MSTHSFDTEEAKKYGTDAAVLLSNIRFWLQHNKANKKHEHDGFYWTFNSSEAFAELFPYMNRRSISRHLKKLNDDGVIKIANYNKAGFDRTQWYTIPSEFATKSLQVNNNAIGQNDQSIGQNDQSIGQNVPTIPDINTDFKPQILNKSDAPQKPEILAEKEPVKIAKEKPAKFVKPDLAEIIAFCLEMTFAVQSGEAFYDYYESVGWTVGGRASMKDWKAALRGWVRREGTFAPKPIAAKKQPLTKFEIPDEWKNDESVLDANAIDSTATQYNNFFAIGGNND
jgi:hypothetical protein